MKLVGNITTMIMLAVFGACLLAGILFAPSVFKRPDNLPLAILMFGFAFASWKLATLANKIGFDGRG